VKFKVTRLSDDDGDGVLTPTTGKVALEWKTHGVWRTIKGSRHLALNGHHTFKFYCSGSLKVRAKALSPTTYSKVVSLRF